MKPENFLQTDLLDILFLNRNKAYGAYELRKHYNIRMVKAFIFTFALCTALVIINHFSGSNEKVKSAFIIPVIDLQIVDLPGAPKKIETPKPASKQAATKEYTIPKIVAEEILEKPLTEISELDGSLIGKMNHLGESFNEGQPMTPPAENATNTKASVPENPVAEVNSPPLYKVEVMPEFPGGMDAFKKFMLRHLHQPELDPGKKVVVKLQFVVDATGAINNIKVIQSGGELDKEVIRVVGKMPKWKPGVQNGRFVSVYFTLPVTFLGENL